MIREYKDSDLDMVNELLSSFNVSLDFSNNEFLKVLVYEEDKIEGALVYDKIYDRIEIEYIIVSVERRNKGIATMLLNSLSNYNNITLEVRKDNIAAISLYEKNGFKIVATRKNYYKDIDGLLMIKGK